MYQYASKSKTQSEGFKSGASTANKNHTKTGIKAPMQRMPKRTSSPLQMLLRPQQENREAQPLPMVLSEEQARLAPRSAQSNNTGIPLQMKEKFENLSGFSFDDVKVHYNSDKPAQLQALAYAQGNQVHIAPGQEKHLEHELGHVVQQKQGRVKPTTSGGSIALNTSIELESEADNYLASQAQHLKEPIDLPFFSHNTQSVVQGIFFGHYDEKKEPYFQLDANEELAKYIKRQVPLGTYWSELDAWAKSWLRPLFKTKTIIAYTWYNLKIGDDKIGVKFNPREISEITNTTKYRISDSYGFINSWAHKDIMFERFRYKDAKRSGNQAPNDYLLVLNVSNFRRRLEIEDIDIKPDTNIEAHAHYNAFARRLECIHYKIDETRYGNKSYPTSNTYSVDPEIAKAISKAEDQYKESIKSSLLKNRGAALLHYT